MLEIIVYLEQFLWGGVYCAYIILDYAIDDRTGAAMRMRWHSELFWKSYRCDQNRKTAIHSDNSQQYDNPLVTSIRLCAIIEIIGNIRITGNMKLSRPRNISNCFASAHLWDCNHYPNTWWSMKNIKKPRSYMIIAIPTAPPYRKPWFLRNKRNGNQNGKWQKSCTLSKLSQINRILGYLRFLPISLRGFSKQYKSWNSHKST